ncbi:hypothetical protein RI367_006397 [Sorochytrium milnesiophthora]
MSNQQHQTNAMQPYTVWTQPTVPAQHLGGQYISTPLAEPRLPRLPAYEEMIAEAVTQLNDPEGVSPRAIFDWMQQTYPMLPRSFRGSATQALKKALHRKRLIRTKRSGYIINPEYDSKPVCGRTKKGGRVSMPMPQSSSPDSSTLPWLRSFPGWHRCTCQHAQSVGAFSEPPYFAATSLSTDWLTWPWNGTTPQLTPSPGSMTWNNSSCMSTGYPSPADAPLPLPTQATYSMPLANPSTLLSSAALPMLSRASNQSSTFGDVQLLASSLPTQPLPSNLDMSSMSACQSTTCHASCHHHHQAPPQCQHTCHHSSTHTTLASLSPTDTAFTNSDAFTDAVSRF